jgi:hypothetical protein
MEMLIARVSPDSLYTCSDTILYGLNSPFQLPLCGQKKPRDGIRHVPRVGRARERKKKILAFHLKICLEYLQIDKHPRIYENEEPNETFYKTNPENTANGIKI